MASGRASRPALMALRSVPRYGTWNRTLPLTAVTGRLPALPADAGLLEPEPAELAVGAARGGLLRGAGDLAAAERIARVQAGGRSPRPDGLTGHLRFADERAPRHATGARARPRREAARRRRGDHPAGSPRRRPHEPDVDSRPRPRPGPRGR